MDLYVTTDPTTVVLFLVPAPVLLQQLVPALFLVLALDAHVQTFLIDSRR